MAGGRDTRYERDTRWPRVALVALVSLVLSISAAAATELEIARQALRDGLWEVARAHAAKTNSVEARLVILESYASEDRWQEVKAVLDGWPDAAGSGFDYYRAVVKGDHAAAAKVLKEGGSAAGLVAVRLFEADALAKSGERDAAAAIWREVAAATNIGERALATASANLMEEGALRRAYAEVRSAQLRRLVGLRLGRTLVRDPKKAEEGAKLVRAIVRDSPDADGAREAFLAVADAALAAGRWQEAADTFREAIEIWPDVAKSGAVQEGRGWALQRLGQREEALEAFRLAATLAVDDAAKATALAKEGDVLAELGRDDEATARYRDVLAKFPKTATAKRLEGVVRVRELESKGRELYRQYRFDAARKTFGEVAAADPARQPLMEFFTVLCLYGEGMDEAAGRRAEALAAGCKDAAVRAEAMLWLAKFRYNRREWQESGRLFAECAEAFGGGEKSAEALLWAARAAFAANDLARAVQLTTRVADGAGGSPLRVQALLVQGETLIELARFDEAVLVLERAAADSGAASADRLRAQTLRADALFAMGADNPARYSAALDAYREILFGGILPPASRIVVAFKIARALEKLKRMDEAIDQYYTQVVLAYREGRAAHVRFDDEARAAFAKAAFRLADEFEGRGRDGEALHVLNLLATSDVQAAEEAKRRMDRLSTKGRFL